MRLAALTLAVLIAFAANSVLNRAAVGAGDIGALTFATVRLGSGAVALAAMVLLRDRRIVLRGAGRIGGVVSLALYMVGFSLAYVALDSGAGALILFGGVQVVMFCGALIGGEQVPRARWVGTAVALAGLAWLLWPGGDAALSPLHCALMAAAALGWGVYSLIGRRAGDPLGATAANFMLATPLAATALIVAALVGDPVAVTARGLGLATVSGVLASAMGYALWYSVLPRLAASTAALVQLSVPILAALGGVAFLGEGLTLRFVLASAVVLGGVALGVLGAQRTASSRGS